MIPSSRPAQKQLRVLIADDHAIIRFGLRQILSETADMRVTSEAENGVQAMQLLRQNECDVAVLDISMPERNGLETLKLIKRETPRLPTIMLSMHPEEQYAIRTLKAGASGYLSKQTAADHIVEAIRTVAAGRRYLSPSVAEQLANALTAVDESHIPPHEKLSDREYQTLCLIASGHALSEIAAHMKLSAKTISVYRARVLEKLRLSTNAELTYYGIKTGLVACAGRRT